MSVSISSLFRILRRPWVIGIVASLLVAIPLFLLVDINIQADFEGVYLLKGEEGKLVEVRDSLYLGEADRLIARIETPRLHAMITHMTPRSAAPHLSCVWNHRRGHGYIHSARSDGSELLICISRFRDSLGRIPKGIFIGGEMPSAFYGDKGVRLNETGFAYRRGGRWYHIWCNANEGIAAGADTNRMIYPSEWVYRGSRVLLDTGQEVAIESRHLTEIDTQPVAIDRFVYHRAADNYLILIIRFRNEGEKPVSFYYVYGDEPWVGNYGSSRGNVGWSPGKFHPYASTVNPVSTNVAGFVDIGNELLPDEREATFTGLANFMGWYGLLRPQLVYFSNKEADVHAESEKIVLDSPQNRVIFAQWAPPELMPGKSCAIILALGLITPERFTLPPAAPEVLIPWETINRAFTLE